MVWPGLVFWERRAGCLTTNATLVHILEAALVRVVGLRGADRRVTDRREVVLGHRTIAPVPLAVDHLQEVVQVPVAARQHLQGIAREALASVSIGWKWLVLEACLL